MPGSSATASSVGSNLATDPATADHPAAIGKYQLLRRIARGGMGEVFLARLPGELGFEKHLVIKTIRPELAADPRFVELFAAEAKIAVGLDHPNIAPIYELGRAPDGTLYTAMAWVDGPSLATVIDRLRERGQTLELGAALFITRELLDGLAHAHSRDRDRPPVVHRDITPRNVLVDRRGRTQIVDFGIAKPAEAEVAGQMGSVGYMAPEQARGEPVDPRADVFGVGCVLFELLTNHRAFTQPDVWMLPDLSQVPAPIRELLDRSLALDPHDRYADAETFLHALAPSLAELAPSYASIGTRNLATILADLFGDDGRPDDGVAAVDATPATHVGAPVVTFATRVGASSPAPAVAAVAIDQPTRRRWGWSIAVLAVIGIGIAITRADDAPAIATREPEPDRAADPAPTAIPDPSPAPSPILVPTPPAVDPTLIVEVEPADAIVELGGERLVGPPYSITPSATAIELHIHHPDHRDRRVTIDDRTPTDQPLTIELAPLGYGSLTVLAPSVAWAEVWLDKTKIGTTPLTDKPVLEGKHKLEVRCLAAVCGIARVLLSRSVRIKPGHDLSLDADD